MAASNGPMPAAGICFSWIRLFFPSGARREEKKNQYLGAQHDGHHFRIEVAVNHCHLVTFVRHCTFKPSFFSPSSSFHSFLPYPIVWIPLVTFYVAIWKLEGKRSSTRESLWNQLVDWFSIYFCLTTPSSSLISSSCLFRPPLCPSRNLFVVYLHSLMPDKDKLDVLCFCGQFSVPVCKWNPLGVLVDGCEKLESLSEW